MVFQNYALYPYLDVAANIAFPLKMAKVPKAERAERVREIAEMLELTDLLGRKPGQLSGGQRQRVAMGRAIVRRPSVFLMDEPLSNLDAKLRVQMRADIAALQARLGVTTVYVTHDQVEAMTMGHRVAVLRDGRLQQCAPPRVLYDHPVNVFVAGFIGSPAMNLCRVPVVEGTASLGGGAVALPAASTAARRSSSACAPRRSSSAATASPAGSRCWRSSAPTSTRSASRSSRPARRGSSRGPGRATRPSAASAYRCARGWRRRTCSTPGRGRGWRADATAPPVAGPRRANARPGSARRARECGNAERGKRRPPQPRGGRYSRTPIASHRLRPEREAGRELAARHPEQRRAAEDRRELARGDVRHSRSPSAPR